DQPAVLVLAIDAIERWHRGQTGVAEGCPKVDEHHVFSDVITQAHRATVERVQREVRRLSARSARRAAPLPRRSAATGECGAQEHAGPPSPRAGHYRRGAPKPHQRPRSASSRRTKPNRSSTAAPPPGYCRRICMLRASTTRFIGVASDTK